jgi:hypothetical protein
MTRTVGDVKARAKSILKDKVDPVRYPEADLLNAVNDALLEVRRIRPDLYLSKSFKVAILINDTDVLPVEDFVFNSIVYWVVGTMMLRDDEFSVDGRAMNMINKATGQLLACAA